MRAEELMIGNWVEYYSERLGRKNTSRIDEIRIDGTILLAEEDGLYFYLNEIKPIPLTGEILKKNGIECVEVGDNGPCTPPKNRNRYEKWFIHTTFRDTSLWHDRVAAYWHLNDMNAVWINNVHELQNALNLSKIDKDIVL